MLKLMPHQEEAVAFLERNNGKGLIADEMGLGKTISAIVALERFTPADERIAVVCPPSVAGNWRREIDKWSPLPDRWDVLRYSQFSREPVKVHLGLYNNVILDESHSIKNLRSNRGKTILKQMQSQERVVLLSGTPIPNEIDELYPQLKVMGLFKGKSLTWFRKRYMNKVFDPFAYDGWSYKGVNDETLPELRAIREATMIRRLKKDAVNLPDKIRGKRYVDVDISEVEDLLEAHIVDEEHMESLLKDEQLATVRRFIGLAKVRSIIEYAEHLLEHGGDDYPIVIMCYHRDVIQKVSRALGHAPIIDGSTNRNRRTELVERFQAGEIKVLVCNIIAAGEGITLNRSSHMIIGELVWRPGQLLQAEDRIHRIGQKRTVNIDYILADVRIEQIVMSILERKQGNISKVME